MLVMFLGLLAFAASQDNIPNCGMLGQDCCRLEHYEGDDRRKFGKTEEQFKTDKFRYCVREEGEAVSDWVCDKETDKCIDEATLDCGREGERCCNLKNDMAGDYPPILVCLDYNTKPYFGVVDLFCDFTDNTCKQYDDLACGFPGKECCSEATLDTSEDYIFWFRRYFNVFDVNCRESWCTSGVCEPCNKPGDKCCEVSNDEYREVVRQPPTEPFCMDILCVDGTCKDCGQEGQLCCDDERKNMWPSDYFEYVTPSCKERNLVCSDGRCVAMEGSCFGDRCKWNEDCSDESRQCLPCGNETRDCCPDGSCADDYLTCFDGKCQCGRPGQKCCWSGPYCYDTAECREGLCWEPGEAAVCGGKGKQCCDGGLCVVNAFCNEKQNKCRACGKKNQKCCPGGACSDDTLTCKFDGRCVEG